MFVRCSHESSSTALSNLSVELLQRQPLANADLILLNSSSRDFLDEMDWRGSQSHRRELGYQRDSLRRRDRRAQDPEYDERLRVQDRDRRRLWRERRRGMLE